jgi:hypothetical protein
MLRLKGEEADENEICRQTVTDPTFRLVGFFPFLLLLPMPNRCHLRLRRRLSHEEPEEGGLMTNDDCSQAERERIIADDR